MPKDGIGEQQWLQRLRAFAAGTFTFKKGQHPPKNSKWAKMLQKISDCPSQKAGSMKRDLFGNEIKCTCSFHPKEKNPHQPLLPTLGGTDVSVDMDNIHVGVGGGRWCGRPVSWCLFVCFATAVKQLSPSCYCFLFCGWGGGGGGDAFFVYVNTVLLMMVTEI
ncbi:hypothetical protein BaRGS_00019560 [Batillaria attramentaria]|uniref:Uncharacterized protein n=1 Tax=Batillaria attramentaria TaxID=370345 RepID=A0ABD0KPR7_9CAEN